MLSFVLHDSNLPFAIALALMLGIALLEGAGALVGIGISGLIDSRLPEGGIEAGFDIDADIDGDFAAMETIGASRLALSSVLGWLCIGRVPILILLIVFLTVFGLAGLAVQGAIDSVFGLLLPGFVAAVPALALALPSVRLFGRAFGRVMPGVDTTAVSRETFVGAVATIIRGKARRGRPPEAKLTDRHGQTHYLLVEPDNKRDSFAAGDEVLLVRQTGSRFRAIANPHAALSRDSSE